MTRATARPKKTSAPAAPKRRGDHGTRAGSEARATFPIVAIGASAGGLEALEQFFSNVPLDRGLAFVVIQHLDPTHKAMLPVLLQRSTAMKVLEVVDGMPVVPECVYVIPPNKDLSILHGTLHLLDPVAPRGLRLPIDFFLRALAGDQGERSIGVILSGMGSDGTLGLGAVKEVGGLTLVQDPTTAKFDSMPRSAIDAGLADIVAPAGELAGKIVETLRFAPLSAVISSPEHESIADKNALDKIIILLRARTGQDFSLYKKNSVCRRIERRMGLHKFDRLADYVRFSSENPQEVDILFKELLIGVTGFFRDPPAWAFLQEHALTTLLAGCPDGRALRAWVVGCSTGEEAYSLAISFSEALEQSKRVGRVTLQIFATDLDRDAIDRARTGLYPANVAADVSPARLARYFVQEGDTYRVAQEIREMVVFAIQNVAMDAPFTRLDILSCRNLLIYLGTELQARLLPLFHYSLNPGGILFLGSAETIGRFSGLFAPIDAKLRVYQSRSDMPVLTQPEFPTRRKPSRETPAQQPTLAAPPTPNLQSLAEQLLLQHFVPPAVLVDGAGNIVFISGRTGKYLEPAAGKANWNIHAMARPGLRNELLVGLPRALRNGETVIQRGIPVGTNDDLRTIDLTIHAIDEPNALRGMALIVFAEVPPADAPTDAGRGAAPDQKRLIELERTLKNLREELQAAREEMQTREEELKSTNEELQSTNEELQSTNEELTTSKEEMQSLNEELQTVNAELQAKVDELSSASNDMKNLLNSTDIATIFLDSALHVRRFTTQATKIFKLIPGDAGRPLSDIVTDLDYPDLQADAHEVLRTLMFTEKEIKTGDGRWFSVKIMPYRTVNNIIDGVVVTFSDISAAKRLEAELRKSLAGPA